MKRNLDLFKTLSLAMALSATALVGCDDETAASETEADMGAGGAGANMGEAGGGGDVGGAGGEAGGAGGEAGGAGGGMTGPVDKCEDGAGDMTALGAINEYGPSARVVSLAIPETPDAATEANCGLVGASNGSGLSALLDLVGGNGLDEFVQPDENGDISLLIFAQAEGMVEGSTVPGTDAVNMNLFVGAQSEAGFMISKSSFVDGDPMNAPLITFQDAPVCDNGYMNAGPSVFSVDLPLVEGLPLNISLEEAALRGFLAVEGSGFNLTGGVVAGYLTRDTLLALVNGIITACAGENPPSLCDTVGPLLGDDPEAGLELLLSFIGDFEATVEANGEVRTCDPAVPDDCNALGVCLQVELGAETIVGIEE